MADLEELYGMNGEILYNGYKNRYETITRKINRGELPATSSSYQELYDKMRSDIQRLLKKEEQFKIKILISLAILGIVLLCTLTNPDENSVFFIIVSAIPLIFTIRGKSKREKELDAIIAFDKEYLNGWVTKS